MDTIVHLIGEKACILLSAPPVAQDVTERKAELAQLEEHLCQEVEADATITIRRRRRLFSLGVVRGSSKIGDTLPSYGLECLGHLAKITSTMASPRQPGTSRRRPRHHPDGLTRAGGVLLDSLRRRSPP
jgi:hypothetical protein